MPSKITAYSQHLHPLAEITAPTTPRSWVLSGYGKADFSMSSSDPKATETNLQFGNVYLIEHIPTKDETGAAKGKLPNWIGKVMPSREWGFGVISKTVYSMEGYLKYCPMPLTKIDGTPRQIFTEIIRHANEFVKHYGGGTVFQFGIVEDKPLTLSDKLVTNAYDHIQTLVARAGMDWDITAETDARGNLLLYANLYQSKGSVTDVVLSNINTELEGGLLSEQGDIFNVVIGYSQSSTPQQRYPGIGVHQGALNDYGPFGVNQVFTGLFDPASVRSAAQVIADKRGRPVKMIPHKVMLDISKVFSAVNTGDTVTVRDTNAGFSPGGGLGFEIASRVITMEYNDLSNKVPLTLRGME